MSELNVENRTLAIMDNLPFLRRLNNECVDLIAIDPPFAANETFTGRPRPPITDAEFAEEVALARSHGVEHSEGRGETRVRDIWSWDDDVHPDWKMRIQDDYPAVHAVIEAVEVCATENEAAYISYMAARLLECHRVLKPTGSLYLHCDGHADSYLKLLLDAVFGPRNYRDKIVWRRHTSSQRGSQFTPRRWGATTDTILFYAKSDGVRVSPFRPLTAEESERRYPLKDENGRRYYDDSAHIWRTPNMGARPNLCYEWRGFTNPHPSGWRLSRERMEEEYQKGNFVILPNGRLQRRKYEDDDRGASIGELWTDVNPAMGRERTGYATQKPVELYERIIKASSQPGDVVMDIFAGCATTAIASERLGRRWIACDMAYRAWTMLKRRFYLNGIALADMTDSTKEALASATKDRGFQEPQQLTASFTLGPADLPVRVDHDPEPHHRLPQARRRGGRQSTQTASWSGRIPKEDAKRMLINRFGPVCWGCGYEPRRPNGSIDETLLEVDHIRARRPVEGAEGNDELYNLALLHRTCNGIKLNRMTLEELRAHNAMNGLLYVDRTSDLVDLYEATRFAAEQIGLHIAERGMQPSF